MTIFLTSSPTGPLDHSRQVDGLDDKNRLVENLRRYWPENARCLYLAAGPAEAELNDRICGDMRGIFEGRGFSVGTFDVWDDRTEDPSCERLCDYDVLVLGGGHVPTQNAFFRRIGLRESIKSFDGVIIGISAGTMNSADVVYAQPELPGESEDPGYERFLEGLGLIGINILPHYQMVKNFELDGRRLFEDITCGDSFGREFFALPDGSYVLMEGGNAVIWGEAYRISDGEIKQICEEDRTIYLSI